MTGLQEYQAENNLFCRFCLWFAPQPACNAMQTQTQKSNRQQSPLEDDVVGRHSLHLKTRKQTFRVALKTLI
jgi:hypothetical protein